MFSSNGVCAFPPITFLIKEHLPPNLYHRRGAIARKSFGAGVAFRSIEGYNQCEVKTIDGRKIYAGGSEDSPQRRGAHVAQSVSRGSHRKGRQDNRGGLTQASGHSARRDSRAEHGGRPCAGGNALRDVRAVFALRTDAALHASNHQRGDKSSGRGYE